SDDIIIGKYDKLYSKILNEERTLLVSLPDGYEGSLGKYPVLFLLDGNVSALSEMYSISRSIGYSSLPPMIIVAIQNTDRNRDMIPGPEKEGAVKFLKFLSDELIPYIEENYRAINYRIIYGASNAGLFVVYSLLEKQDAFSAFLTSSPTIIWAHDYMVDKVKKLSVAPGVMDKFLYIIYADNEWPKVRDTLNTFIPRLESLKHKGLQLQSNFLPDEGHVPVNSLFKGLMSLFEGYEYPDEKRRNEGLDSLKFYYDRFSKNIGYKVKYPFMALMGLGQGLLFANKSDEAIEVFKLFSQNYPEDIYGDIMLAIAYYKNDNMELSKKYFLKAKKNKQLEIPPFPEWSEMETKFK
ncbi:alpha/beta hydrolase-fold protein, partial [Bacteroidota bacterium]